MLLRSHEFQWLKWIVLPGEAQTQCLKECHLQQFQFRTDCAQVYNKHLKSMGIYVHMAGWDPAEGRIGSEFHTSEPNRSRYSTWGGRWQIGCAESLGHHAHFAADRWKSISSDQIHQQPSQANPCHRHPHSDPAKWLPCNLPLPRQSFHSAGGGSCEWSLHLACLKPDGAFSIWQTDTLGLKVAWAETPWPYLSGYLLIKVRMQTSRPNWHIQNLISIF